MEIAQAILTIVARYAVAGILFAAMFVLRGVERIDSTAHHGSWGFRALIFPASAALWPWLLAKWLRARRGEQA